MTDVEKSVQINDGFSQTSGDGATLCFDSKYGIMFCSYMPGMQCNYGESRGKISLSVFPASQPTNIRFVDISSDKDDYCCNMLGLGNGKVRVFYEKNSRADCDHYTCYKDYDFLSDALSEEKKVMIKKGDGSIVPFTLSEVFEYLDAHGAKKHIYKETEQTGYTTFFAGDDGYIYGAAPSYLSEVPLYRSKDNMATVEFFAIYPELVQYEFEYRFLNGKIYTVYRTDKETDCIAYTYSSDMGKTWKEPVYFKDTIQCRPRMIVYKNHILTCCNYFNDDTGNRPKIQQGRTSVRFYYGENDDPNTNDVLADFHSKYGIVNVCITDILNDVYMAFSSSELALEYQNGNPMVRGKDAVRYIKLGDMTK